jgi:tubulin-specific chaperone E
MPASLRYLNLDDNDFSELIELQPVTSLSRLQRLSLRNNRIATTSGRTGRGDAETSDLQSRNLQFPASLRELDLSHNAIDSWELVSSLQAIFPGLSSLRIAHNPLFQYFEESQGRPLSAEDGYSLVLARLPNLSSLNYSQITSKDRLDADTYYLSRIAEEIAAVPEGQEECITSRHPRFAELCREYGHPVVQRPERPSISPNSLAARLITLNCYFANQAPEEVKLLGDSNLVIEVPRNLQVYSVMGLIGKWLQKAPMKVALVWETDELDPVKNGAETSDSEDDAKDNYSGVMERREVQIVAGTRAIGTWIEGNEARVRIELRDASWHSAHA